MPSDPSSERRRKARAEQGLTADARPITIGPLRAPTAPPNQSASARSGDPDPVSSHELTEIRRSVSELTELARSGGIFRAGQQSLAGTIVLGVGFGMLFGAAMIAVVAVVVRSIAQSGGVT